MKEINGTRLIQAVKSIVCLRSIVFCPPAMLLCFISGVTGISFLFEGNFRVRAAQHGQNGLEKLSPPVMNLPRLVSFGHALAKSRASEDRVWRKIEKDDFLRSHATAGVIPPFYRSVSLDAAAQKQVLRHAPMEFTKAARQTQVVMTLPMPDGTFARFRIEESPVMAPLLAARFPQIKTYRGQGLDDPTATTRFDVTPAGFHAIVLSTQGTVIIEPASRGRAGQYVSYDQRDAPKDAGSFNCLVSGAEQSIQSESKQPSRNGYPAVDATSGATLRTYRLALAATAEYTQTYGGGTVAGAMSALTTTINAVNAIYERDLAIRLMLIDNETSIIFTNPATDGYTSDNATSLVDQNQVILDQRIGSANYDVGMVLDGHVYAFQPGHFIFQGAAQYQSVCGNGQKARASQYCVPLSRPRPTPSMLSPMSWVICSGRCTHLTAPLTTVAPVVLLRLRMNREVARPLWATEAAYCPTGLIFPFVAPRNSIRMTLTSTPRALNRSSITPPLAPAASARS